MNYIQDLKLNKQVEQFCTRVQDTDVIVITASVTNLIRHLQCKSYCTIDQNIIIVGSIVQFGKTIYERLQISVMRRNVG